MCRAGNGKTTLAAPIGLYLTFVEGEGGAEGYAAAVTRDQARILFDAAQNMVRRSPGFRAAFGVGVGANAVHQESTASRFAPVSSDAKALDGLNVQIAVCDEIASHKTSEVYDVPLTAMGKRPQSLLLSISTATGNSSEIGKQLWDYAGRVLDGTQEDKHLFGKPDRRGNLYPAKQRPEQKIDAAVALMMAVGRAVAEDTNDGDLTDFLRNPLIA